MQAAILFFAMGGRLPRQFFEVADYKVTFGAIWVADPMRHN
jgi:hypothetical protein